MNLKPEMLTMEVETDKIDFLNNKKQQEERIIMKRREISVDKKTGDQNISLKIGDLVMVKTEERGLLKKRFTGPWRVIKFLNNCNLELEDGKKIIRRNVHQVKRFNGKFPGNKGIRQESIISASNSVKTIINVNRNSEEEPKRFRERYPERERKRNPRYLTNS